MGRDGIIGMGWDGMGHGIGIGMHEGIGKLKGVFLIPMVGSSNGWMDGWMNGLGGSSLTMMGLEMVWTGRMDMSDGDPDYTRTGGLFLFG